MADAARGNVDGVDLRERISGARDAPDLPVNFSLDVQNMEEHFDSG